MYSRYTNNREDTNENNNPKTGLYHVGTWMFEDTEVCLRPQYSGFAASD
jgi:hypothetical protein